MIKMFARCAASERFLTGEPKGPMMRGWIALLAGVLVLSLALSQAPAVDADRSPDVLILTLESVRADHLPCYGYDRNTTPVLCDLAADGVLFEEAYAQGSHTYMSVPSMLTSEIQTAVGTAECCRRLPQDATTMLEAARDAGYRTRANMIGAGEVRWADGAMERYHTAHLTGTFRPDDTVKQYPDVPDRNLSDDASFIREVLAADGPVFAWHFYRENHLPYLPPRTDQYWGDIDMDPADLQEHWSIEHPDKELTRSQRIDLYDGELRMADRKIDAVLQELRDSGRYDDTLIVLVSDHGDAFGEHGEDGHGGPPYREQIHVPFIIKFPGNRHAGTRVSQPVRLLDLAPTLYDHLGIPRPDTVDGRSLLPVIAGETVDLPVFATGEWGGAEDSPWAYRDDDHSYILRNPRQVCVRGEEPDHELYHLPSDPAEQDDLAADRPAVAASLQDATCTRYWEGLRRHLYNRTETLGYTGRLETS